MVATVTFAPGVHRRDESGHAVYTGRADALVAAGLVEQHQLPGHAGNGRGIVLVEGDATTPKKRIIACVRDGEPKLEVWQTLQHWPFPVIGNTFMGEPIPEEPKPASRRPRCRKAAAPWTVDLSEEQRFFVAQVPSVLRALRDRINTPRVLKSEMTLEEALQVIARAVRAGNLDPIEYLIAVCRGGEFDRVKAAAAIRDGQKCTEASTGSDEAGASA